MDSEEILNKRLKSPPQEEDQAGEDSGLTPRGGTVEDIAPAQTADDLEQEPEEKQNRAQAGDPPEEELVKPGGEVDR